MLRRASELTGYTLGARDGEIGTVGDFYFDDQSWTVQYLVAHTGSWLSDRLVLIARSALRPTNPDDRIIPVDVTKEEVENSSSPDTNRPLDRHDPHLRSTYAMSGCHIQAEDAAFGHVEDFVIDDEAWMIRYLIVDTRNWWPGKRVLVSPQWVERVNWTDSKIFVALPRETIKQAPEYTADAVITREYEAALYRHYKRERYW
jgi:hypothetical protein